MGKCVYDDRRVKNIFHIDIIYLHIYLSRDDANDDDDVRAGGCSGHVLRSPGAAGSPATLITHDGPHLRCQNIIRILYQYSQNLNI